MSCRRIAKILATGNLPFLVTHTVTRPFPMRISREILRYAIEHQIAEIDRHGAAGARRIEQAKMVETRALLLETGRQIDRKGLAFEIARLCVVALNEKADLASTGGRGRIVSERPVVL